MNKLFYPHLAAINIRKNRKTYLPYILTCIGTIMMFYIISAIAKNEKMAEQVTGGEQLLYMMMFGVWVIGIFSVIYLFYTNSFLIKRRKKEFGLFNILGMEKRHISRLMAWETLYVALISFAAGIPGGILLSKLIQLLLLKILRFDVMLGFEVSGDAVVGTLALFGAIFLLTLLNTLRQIHLAKPAELLRGGNVGEKEPKTKWLMTVIGVVCIAAAYYIAIVTEDPLETLFLFFVAVILVIIGTYCLFAAGSIAFLKLLKKNKKYYYQTGHFISVSGMIYRMKQNAVGLANICILSTVVLVMISGTVSLYFGMEDVLHTRYPRNIAVTARNIDDENTENMETLIRETAGAYHVQPENILAYRRTSAVVSKSGEIFDYEGPATAETAEVIMIPLEDYNALYQEGLTLEEGETALYIFRGNVPGNSVSFGGETYRIRERLDAFQVDGDTAVMIRNTYFFIMPDMASIERAMGFVLEEEETEFKDLCRYYFAFDAALEDAEQEALAMDISAAISDHDINGYVEAESAGKSDFYMVYGGLFFLGIFLGVLFIMATVLIIYYKQISEGYEDRERFSIMQKVGMSRFEVKKAIRSQVLTVFFLPLVMAGIHIAASFKMISRLLAMLNLNNVGLFAVCTLVTMLVFALFYALVYVLTAREYYKIVK